MRCRCKWCGLQQTIKRRSVPYECRSRSNADHRQLTKRNTSYAPVEKIRQDGLRESGNYFWHNLK